MTKIGDYKDHMTAPIGAIKIDSEAKEPIKILMNPKKKIIIMIDFIRHCSIIQKEE